MKGESEKRNSRVVIITGSSRGIGFATAAEFLKHGDKVVIFCRHEEHVDEAVENLGKIAKPNRTRRDVLGLVADVREPADVKEAVRKTLKTFGRIDVLVNNAGTAVWKAIEETRENEWDDILDTNLKGSFLFIRLRRRPRASPVDVRPPQWRCHRYGGWKCVNCARIIHKLKYCCFGGFRRWRITLRSLGVGGYFMEVPRASPVGLHA